MTEYDAAQLHYGDIVQFKGEACRVLRVHKRPVLVECQTINRDYPHWHLVRPGRCRKLPQ